MINISKLAAVARAKPKIKVVPTSSANADQEMMSRRAALRRIGMTSGIAVLGLLTIDDLARVASQKLEQNELTRGIAKDFKSAGVAFADTWEGGYYEVDTQPKPPSVDEVIDAYDRCLRENPDPKQAWPCLAREVGQDTFDKNWEYIWCGAVTRGGTENQELCPGFPEHGPCDQTNPVTYVCANCCEAQNAQCIGKGGYLSVSKCNNELIICEYQNC